MKKSTAMGIFIPLGIVILLVIIIIATGAGSYNSMVTKREEVRSQWSNVENQYQRRADLIPNLVNTVKGYAEHESSTLESVIAARSRATQAQVNFDQLNEQTLNQYNSAQGELTSALGRLLAISESYPDLKANQNFRDLQVQLEGTENRIATERRKFNETAQGYNSYIKRFPRNIVASIFNFDEVAYFTALPESQTAPVVSF